MTWLVCLGECMIELQEVADPERPGLMRRSFGGDTLNTAVYLARCLEARGLEEGGLEGQGVSASSGARVDYVTALGDDPFSAEMMAAWEAEGLGTGLVRRLEGRRPGLYMIRTDAAGDRAFSYWRTASAAREVIRAWGAEALAARLTGCDLFYFSGISLGILDAESRDRLLRLAAGVRAEGGRVAFDSNYRPAIWESPAAAREWSERAYRTISIALPSFEDEAGLHGDASPEATAERLRALGVEEVVLKRGPEACLLDYDGGRDWIAAEAISRPRDTTAAGDSFNAAYLVARVLGQDPRAAARAGSRLAAKVVQAPGAIVPRSVFPGTVRVARGRA